MPSISDSPVRMSLMWDATHKNQTCKGAYIMTIQETIELYKQYIYESEKQAHRAFTQGDMKMAAFYEGKADACSVVVFDLEHNLSK